MNKLIPIFFNPFFLIVTGMFLFFTVAVNFTSGISDASEICMACHEDPDLFMEKNGKKVSLYVSPAAYKNSVHSIAECNDCHSGYNPDEIPHTKTAVKVDCISCHKDNKLEHLKSSVHVNTKCFDCHSKHEIKSAKEFVKKQSENCLRCHKTKNIQQYKTSIHSIKNIGCEDCHQGGHSVKKFSKSEITSACGKCHSQHEMNFRNSIHQSVMTSGRKTAPSCVDCHGSHKIIRSKMSIETQACLKCHLDEKLFPGEQKGSAQFVAKYKTSIHASIEKDGLEAATCIDCHGNHNIQNPDNPQSSTTRTHLPETCGKCHSSVVKKYLGSAHGKSLLNRSASAPTCVSCHSEHSIQSVERSENMSKLSQVDICLDCHLEGKLPHKDYKGEEVLISNYKNSHHYKALLDGKNEAATCSDCHGAHEMNTTNDPSSKIHRKNIPKTCGQSGCHVKQMNEFAGSIHEISLIMKSSTDAPNCTNCHGNHQIVQKEEKGNLISNPKGLVQLCSSCHNSVELAEKYAIPVRRTESFKESFHGLAIRGGSKTAANCESCHGHHNIRPSDDTLSTIYKVNLPNTCGKCHPGAVEAFFMTPIHITTSEEDSPWVYWITRIYLFLIFAIIGGMILHNALDFMKKFKAKKKS